MVLFLEMGDIMINIGICDDEKVIVDLLKRLLQECLVELGIEGRITEFYSGEELLMNLSCEDIFFLDIEMSGLNGIETGRRIYERRRDCRIIIASSWIKYFKEAFKINAFRFITKPFQKEEVKEALEAILKIRLGMKTIKLYKKRNIYTFFQKEIRYMIVVDSAVEFVLKGEIYRKETSLKELEKILDDRLFYRINKKCIVNLGEIKKYENGKIFLDEAEMKVSVRKKKDFEKKYLMYSMYYG